MVLTYKSHYLTAEGHAVMESSLYGRVKKYKTSQTGWTMALYEAISNSIYSIESRQPNTRHIEIIITRAPQLVESNSKSKPPIRDIIISDNGIGFNKENFEAFKCLDSEYSVEKGRKGEGRISWLAYFDKTEINSTFIENGYYQDISFNFSLVGNGISDISIQPSIRNTPTTIVKLLSLMPKSQKASQKDEEEIASLIISHFLADFLTNRVPEITIRDEYQTNSISLTEIFNRDYTGVKELSNFSINDCEFKLNHLLCEVNNLKKKLEHCIHWCGQGRSVSGQKLTAVPFLSESICIDGKYYSYIGVLQSPYLDEAVDDKRSVFMLPTDNELDGLEGVTKKAIEENVIETVTNFLENYLDKAKATSLSILKSKIDNQFPEYKHLLHKYHKELSKKNFSSMSDMDIENHLHALERRERESIKKQTREMMHTGKEDLPTIKAKIEELMETLSEVNKIDLSRYVIGRKIILDLLESLISRQADGKFAREERIHDLVFPMIETSKDVDFFNHNLWLLDDRLSFHTLLSSDLPMNHVIEEGSSKEADLIAVREFSSIHLTREGLRSEVLHSATLVEFKRPEVTGFNDSKNPITQLIKYARELKNGKIRDDFTGRTIKLDAKAPIYAYAVTDIDSKFEEIIQSYSLRPTPDNQGYYGYNDQLNIYFEVISFDKLLSDAKKRNHAFFKKLGL